MDSRNPQQPKDTPLLELRGIEKSFFGVRVLKGVDVRVDAAQIVGLVGENGAGKSTLMNILGGNLQPDRGVMLLNEEPFEPRHPTDAKRLGIAFVHQELNLFPNLSIAENIFLTSFPRAGGPFIARRQLHVKAAELLREVGLEISPIALVEDLSAGERQLVEIARALSVSPRLIILDEPTTSLSTRETATLFALMNRLRERGLAMIYISHILGDVLRLCDEIVVLRDGEVVGNGLRAEFTAERMISLMVGRELDQLYPHRTRPDQTTENSKAAALLEVRGITQPHIVRDVSFTLNRGEVLGISGLMGAGRSELARILFGLDPYESGEILRSA